MAAKGPTLGETLREYRRRAALTQDEAATAAGISVRTLRDLEQDRPGRPRRRSVAALAEVLHLPPGSWEAQVGPAGAGRLTIGVLGPLILRRGDAELEPAAALPRRLLALLALHAGEPVSRDRIVEALWPEAVPPSSQNLIHTYVAAVRRALEPDRPAGSSRLLPRAGDGYRLVPTEDELDLLRFRAAASAGQLREALALWRGPVLGGADPVLGALPVTAALAAERLDVALRYADLCARDGEHQQAVTALQALAVDEPLHEGLHARLITALSASGAQSAARRLYEDVSARLADELGVEPTAELRAAVSAGVPVPAYPVPAQLPPAGRYFTGRGTELAQLDAVAQTLDAGGASVVISAVTGTAGVGKTALALHWAHRAAPRFPDGQLYVNLRGFDPAGPLDPADALRGMLLALGLSADRIPVDTAERAGLLRSTLAGRRVLLLLDNARDAEQVRTLLPGSAGCLALVTSRDRMAGLLVTDGAVPVALDLPGTAEARDLLARRLGAARLAAEPTAALDIIEMCAHLPLALAVVAARAATTPRLKLGDLTAELRAARLDALDGGDLPSDVRAVLSWSVHALAPAAQRLFRLLAVHPGPQVTVPAAASLAGEDPADVEQTLRVLTAVNLLEVTGPGEYRLHDLLRAYARETPAPEQAAAFARLADYYVRAGDLADRHMYPHRRSFPLPPPVAGVAVPPLPDRDAAEAWFDAEWAAIPLVGGAAAAAGLDAHVWHYGWMTAVSGFLRNDLAAQLDAQSAAIAAAQRLGDRHREGISRNDLGQALMALRRIDEAVEQLRRAQGLAEEIGDGHTAGRAHLTLSRLRAEANDMVAALDHAERAQRAFHDVGDQVGRALALNSAGWAAGEIDDWQRALALCLDALALSEELGDTSSAAAALDSVGWAYHQLGDQDRAREFLGRSVATLVDLDNRTDIAIVLDHLADAELAAGDRAAARRASARAIAFLQEFDPAQADALRAKASAYDHSSER